MDSMSGQFVEEDRAEKWMARVEVGEIVKIKGEELEIVKIEGREMTLKLLSAEERMTLRESLQEMQEKNAASLFDRPVPKRKRESSRRP